MWRREKSMLGTARAQEAEELKREQEYARHLAEEPARRAAEVEHTQRVLDAIARVEFTERFKTKPKVAGESDFYGRYHIPVFSIEYANLRFKPGEYTVHWIEYPGGWRTERGLGSMALRSTKHLWNSDLRLCDQHVMASSGCEFEAVGLCSGCQEWGALGTLETYNHRMFLKQPRIRGYESIASNIELFNEAASGLALDCGTLPIFGFDASKTSAAIECENLKRAIEEENVRRGVKTGRTLDKEKRQLGKSAVGDAVRAARRSRGEKI